MLLRAVRCIQGQVDLVLNCEPVFDYGRTDARWAYTGPGWERGDRDRGRGGPAPAAHDRHARGPRGRAAVAITRLDDGDAAFAALSWDGDLNPPPPTRPRRGR